MHIILFVLYQVFSVFSLQSISLNKIYTHSSYVQYLAPLPNNQKANFEQIINSAAGLDKRLDRIEWQLYLKTNLGFASKSENQVFIKIIEQILNNSKTSLKAAIGIENKTNFFDILVYGDELPGIAAAIMAQRAYEKPLRIALIRPNAAHEPLAGLITRAGLAYLDRNQINNEYLNQPKSSENIFTEFYKEFLEKAQVKKISLDPALANQILRQMLAEAQIETISEMPIEALVNKNKIYALQIKGTQRQLKANIYIDASQNADLARSAGLKYDLGFTGLGLQNITLPVSPVFITKNLSSQQLQQIEKKILENPYLMKQIKKKIKEDIPDQAYADWLLKNLYKPMFIGEDYIDISSIALGALYHLEQGKVYNLKSGFLFDRANIAILKDGSLSWNAFLYKISPQQILYNGSKPSSQMLAELNNFEKWLNKNKLTRQNIQVIPPAEIYIRHLLNITDIIKPLSSQQILLGGVPQEDSIGAFSYYFDIRGGLEGLKGKMLKPVFNFGIEHSLSKIENLAIVGPSSGYTGLAPALGRILELNTNIGSGIGVAAALSLKKNKSFNQITSKELSQNNNLEFAMQTNFKRPFAK